METAVDCKHEGALEDGMDILDHFKFHSGLPLERWLINRRRRHDGRPPF